MSISLVYTRRRMDMERVEFRWTHRWSKTYQQTIFYNTYQPKTPYPVALKFFKGELHALFSRRFTEFLLESEHGRKYLEWCWDTGHPSEHYWNTLNYNQHLDAPGGYTGRRFALEVAWILISRLMRNAKSRNMWHFPSHSLSLFRSFSKSIRLVAKKFPSYYDYRQPV